MPIVTEMTYTPTGQIATVTDPSGAVTSYTYDALGRQTSITQPEPDGTGPYEPRSGQRWKWRWWACWGRWSESGSNF